MKVTKLVINRARWGREVLLNEQTRSMCCLGFLALKCGAADSEIEGEGQPGDVPNIDWPPAFVKLLPKHGSLENSVLAERAININDNSRLTWKEKEAKLIPLFKKAGIKLTFKGKRTDGEE